MRYALVEATVVEEAGTTPPRDVGDSVTASGDGERGLSFPKHTRREVVERRRIGKHEAPAPDRNRSRRLGASQRPPREQREAESTADEDTDERSAHWLVRCGTRSYDITLDLQRPRKVRRAGPPVGRQLLERRQHRRLDVGGDR